jgi:predicted amidohydrolase YtcJ
MGVKVVRELLRRNPAIPPERIGDVIMAATAQVGDQGLTLGRDVGLLAGIPASVPGFAVDRMCAGALTAVTAGAGEIGWGAADLVLAGGRIFTADPARPFAEAVAVRQGRIVAVGDRDSVEALAGPRTRRVSLRDRLLVPGFQDAHIHSMASGLARRGCVLQHFSGIAAYQAAIAAWATEHPDAPWVTGEGWSMSDFPGGNPSRDLLDAVVPDRPAFFWSRDGHSAWVNTRALEFGGVGPETADPPAGRIVRDAAGAPAGTLHEAAIDLVEHLLPNDTQADRERAILTAQAELHALGLTAWQEMNVRPDDLEAWLAVASRTGADRLTARVVGALLLDRDVLGEDLSPLAALRDRGRAGRFRATHVKIFADGIVENFSAAMLDPYLDGQGRPTEQRGESIVPVERLAADVVRLDAMGFHVHIHAIGDRAVREALDAFEAAIRANPARDRRHQVAHIQVIHPADIGRFAELGVIPNGQPYWACHEDTQERLTIPFLGPERTAWQYPFRSLVDAGARLAFGSDWSVSTPNPLLEIELAVTRVSDAQRGTREPFLPHERLDLATALTAFTAGSAYASGIDDETGSIEPGKLADLALIDRDLFAADAGPIGDARILLTLVEGEPVFEAEPVVEPARSAEHGGRQAPG